MNRQKVLRSPLKRKDLQSRFLALGISLAPLVGGELYNKGYQIPYECPIHYFTGLPCPTCGMTRSIMAAMRGEWKASLGYHLFGPFFILILSGIIINIIIEFVAKRSTFLFHFLIIYSHRLTTIFLCTLIGYHLTRLVIMYQEGFLIDSILNSPLGKLFSLSYVI